MAIDAARITSLIDELGLEGADKDYFTNVLTKNEKAATQFAGQRERHDAFTRRTQELSTKEKDLSARANAAIAEYAQQLQAADNKVRQIMADFEKETISRATAEARLQKVKTTYNLSDEDIPAVDPTSNAGNGNRGSRTSGTGQGSDGGIDIKSVLADFKKQLLAELGPELAAFPRVAAIQNEILAQHQELTGKRMTRAQMEELMKISQAADGPNLMTAWRQKYDIDTIEKTKEREGWAKEERKKWDDELKAKNSEEALRGVRNTTEGTVKAHSPVIGRKFNTHDEPANRTVETKPTQQNTQVTQPANDRGPKLSGAERAAARFIERRNNGIPMGAPDPVGAGSGAGR